MSIAVPEQRPDPDALLARVQEDEARARRGRLKIFFGASAGVGCLSEEGINIQMISTSEIKTSVVIDEKYMELAVRALHKVFDLSSTDNASTRTTTVANHAAASGQPRSAKRVR